MKKILRFGISSVVVGVGLLGCAYSKTCNDGVCTIVENGQTRYEGDPAKIAKLKGEKAAAAKAEADLVQRVRTAPKRQGNEPVRVALLPAEGNDGELAKMAPVYDGMIRQEFAKQSGLQLVDASTVTRAWNAATTRDDGFGGHMASHQDRLPLNCDADGARRMRHAGVDADVLVFTTLVPQTKTGFLKGSGKNGAALAQVNVVEFHTCVTALYDSKPFTLKDIGDSTNNLAVAGINKQGKTGAGELKFRRNAEQDRKAVTRLAATTAGRIRKEIRPTLASLSALRTIEARQPATKQKVQIKNASDLKKLFGG